MDLPVLSSCEYQLNEWMTNEQWLSLMFDQYQSNEWMTNEQWLFLMFKQYQPNEWMTTITNV